MTTERKIARLVVSVLGAVLGLLAVSCGDVAPEIATDVGAPDAGVVDAVSSDRPRENAAYLEAAVQVIRAGEAEVSCGGQADGARCSYVVMSSLFDGTLAGSCHAGVGCCLGCWDGKECQLGVSDSACGVGGSPSCEDCRVKKKTCLSDEALPTFHREPFFRCL